MERSHADRVSGCSGGYLCRQMTEIKHSRSLEAKDTRVAGPRSTESYPPTEELRALDYSMSGSRPCQSGLQLGRSGEA